MTATAARATRTKDAAPRKGLTIERVFTKKGVHPYDEVAWERRDARITNFKDGSVAFEQLDVEFPVSGSLNATNIVAQKYVRGTPGTPQREPSPMATGTSSLSALMTIPISLIPAAAAASTA